MVSLKDNFQVELTSVLHLCEFCPCLPHWALTVVLCEGEDMSPPYTHKRQRAREAKRPAPGYLTSRWQF